MIVVFGFITFISLAMAIKEEEFRLDDKITDMNIVRINTLTLCSFGLLSVLLIFSYFAAKKRPCATEFVCPSFVFGTVVLILTTTTFDSRFTLQQKDTLAALVIIMY